MLREPEGLEISFHLFRPPSLPGSESWLSLVLFYNENSACQSSGISPGPSIRIIDSYVLRTRRLPRDLMPIKRETEAWGEP